MITKTAPPAFIMFAGLGTPPLLRQTPGDVQRPFHASRSDIPSASRKARIQKRREALIAFAVGFADKLRRLGRAGGAASIAGQASSAAIDGVASADRTRACARIR